MGRVVRLQRQQRGRRVRLLIFLSGGLLAGFLLIKNLSDQPTAIKPPPAPENTKDSFIFYEALKERNTDGSELMPLTPRTEKPTAVLPGNSPQRYGGTSNPPEAGYTVQVAAFSDQATAQALAGRLVKKGYKAYLNPQQIPGKGLWHRVRIGHYRERQEAERMVERLLKNEQLTGFVAVETGSIFIK